LRIGTAQGMVTVRRNGQRLVFVTWDNADAEMRQAWNALTWAFAEAGEGQIQTAAGASSARDFLPHAEVPVALCDKSRDR
jgi:hypothetical protein